MKKILLVTVAALAAMSALAAKPALRIYGDRNRPDTVTRSTYYVIGITEPGASAWIDGKEAHVYKTGSFGAEITLKDGKNVIPVKVKTAKGTNEVKRTVVLTDPKPAAKAEVRHDVIFDTPRYAVTDSGAYLQYGNGADRLGGSKMGFLDAGVGLVLEGENGSLYKVRLSENNYAYVPKSYVHEGDFDPAVVNSGSATIWNAGKCDRVLVNLPRRVAYSSVTEIDPQVIKVSLYGVTNNTNWLVRKGEPGIVKFVDIRQDNDVMTFYIRLSDKNNWGYSVYYDRNALVIDVRHSPASLALKDLTIGLDAGHGGEYPGARSPSGLLEKDVNLDIVLKVADILRAKGAKVVLTREGDTGPSMTERKRIWRDANVDLAVSVHNNSSGNPLKPMGASVYYKHLFNFGLAEAIHSSMISLGLVDFGLTGNFSFSLNGPTDYPNALVEGLFMSSLPEEEMLADPDYRRRMAEKIVEGIEAYLRSAE